MNPDLLSRSRTILGLVFLALAAGRDDDEKASAMQPTFALSSP